MTTRPRSTERVALRLLNAVDAAFNRLYGWRGNPIYQSGTIAVVLLLVLIVTGLWLIFFYRVGSPYDSVARINADIWIGRWVRALHRYASDAAVVAIVLHAFRMFAQGRSWGPRALAWSSGVILFLLVFVVGLTGYVMVWDTFGMRIAQEGARIIDSLPILSEPIGRASPIAICLCSDWSKLSSRQSPRSWPAPNLLRKTPTYCYRNPKSWRLWPR